MPKDNKTPQNSGRFLAITVLIVVIIAAIGIGWAILASEKAKEIEYQKNAEKANEEIQNFLQGEGWKEKR